MSKFSFPYQLPSGAEIHVDAEVYIPKEDVILALSFPHCSGKRAEEMLQDAADLYSDIEVVAWDMALDRKARGEDVA